MYSSYLHPLISKKLTRKNLDLVGKDNLFFTRFIANAADIRSLFDGLYGHRADKDIHFEKLIEIVCEAYTKRPQSLKINDHLKEENDHWFLSNELTGMSLYVDRFCGSLANLADKTAYFEELGVNLLHLMPIMESSAGESDGGYAVADFRKVDTTFGTLNDLKRVQEKMLAENMKLMLDIVVNHTSNQHEWAQKARQGDKKYQDYYYMYDNRTVPDEYEKSMPEIFPEAAPGNFTWLPECNKWVMTVFHNYQWDLNYTNPALFNEMMDTIFFYANLGVDILRIDAPAFIWKQPGTTCQNLPGAHTILRLIRQCVEVAAPGLALLGEAIVAPGEIRKYFGTGMYMAKECDLAYNATQMALQWDALATGDTRVMLAAQHEILQKPYGTSWITYTRCHDDIGLGYEDYMIVNAGYDPFHHRKYLKEYYSGVVEGSPAKGLLFSVNPKTQDARISGSLASLCGLEKAVQDNDLGAIDASIKKILMMQAHSFFTSGVPMLFYGDEVGYTNDYSYLDEPEKSYDNRWAHRPVINWGKNKKIEEPGSVEQRIYADTKRLIEIRKKLNVLADHKNITWLHPHNIHVAGLLRTLDEQKLYCVFNYSVQTSYLSWVAFKQHGPAPTKLYDHWEQKYFKVGEDSEHLIMAPYTFHIFEVDK